MAIVSQGACGKTWNQHGNRTGHCSARHKTFEGLSLFDWHQVLADDGRVICRDPSEPRWASKGLRFIDGMWRGPAWAADVFKAKGGDDERHDANI